HGQRVLAILVKPGIAPEGRVFESAESPDGWRAYPPTPDPADALLPALRALADAAAADFADDRRFEESTLKALALFDVSVVAATDGTNPVLPVVGERDPALWPDPEVPGVRIRHAAPVFLFLAEEPSIQPDDP